MNSGERGGDVGIIIESILASLVLNEADSEARTN
jgi:hypothetical protein